MPRAISHVPRDGDLGLPASECKREPYPRPPIATSAATDSLQRDEVVSLVVSAVVEEQA